MRYTLFRRYEGLPGNLRVFPGSDSQILVTNISCYNTEHCATFTIIFSYAEVGSDDYF